MASASAILASGSDLQELDGRGVTLVQAELLREIAIVTSSPSALLLSGKDFQALSDHDLVVCICELLREIDAITDSPSKIMLDGEDFQEMDPNALLVDQTELMRQIANVTSSPSALLLSGEAFQQLTARDLYICITELFREIALSTASPSTILSSGKDFYQCADRDLQIIIAELLREGFASGRIGGCPTITVLELLWDSFESYANGSPLNGLNAGSNFCTKPSAAYVDHNGYLGLLATDDFESYANAAEVLGLNGGTGWNGAYGAENVSVQINAGSPNQWPTNGSNTTIVASASGGFPAYTYQWYKNGVALTNVGHYTGVTTATLTITGFDNTDDAGYTVVVTDTTARAYTSATCTTLVASSNAQLWASLVAQTNSGAWPSQATVSAFDTWDAAVTTAGIKARLYHVNLVAPDSLIAALTPFIATNGFTYYGSHGHNGGGASVNVNGFVSAGTVYETVDPSTIASFNSGNMGHSIYFSPGFPGIDNFLTGYVSSVAGGRPAFSLSPRSAFNGTYNAFCGLETAGIDMAGTFSNGTAGGFCMVSRTSTTSNLLYFGASGAAWAQINSGNTANSQGPAARTMGFGGNQNYEGGSYFSSATRFSFYAVHDGFSSADGQALFNATQALRVTLGGGFG